MSLSFSETVFALAFVTGVDAVKMKTFESRIKQWRKMGFPDGVNVGKGVKAKYEATQVFQLVIMLRLLRIGLPPERAIHIIKNGWENLKDSIIETAICRSNGAEHLHYCFIGTDALHELTTADCNEMPVHTQLFTSDDVVMAYCDPEEDWPDDEKSYHNYIGYHVKNSLASAICIEMDSLMILVWTALNAMGKDGSVFHNEFSVWEENRRLRKTHPAQPDKEHFDELLKRGQGSLSESIAETDIAKMAYQSIRGLGNDGDS